MSPKSFLLLAAATAVSVGLAVHAIADRDVPVTTVRASDPVFPGLLDRLNELATVRVTSGGTTTTLRRESGGWTVAEKSGYPADAGKVRELALAVASLRLVEAKTREPERLKRLELADPAPEGAAKGEGARSRLVVLEDGQGRRLGALVVGKARYGLYGPGRAGAYVRRDGETQAWLADREVTLPGDTLDWLVKDVVDIPPRELASVTLAAGTPQPVVMRRPSREAEALELEGVPAGRKADADKVERVADVVSRLQLQDVVRADRLGVPADAPRARFETVDGLRLDVTLARTGEGDQAEHWLLLAASEGTALPPPAAGTPDSGTSASDNATNGEPATAAAPGSGATSPAPTARPNAAERAAELNRRLQGWAFKVQPYLAERLGWGVEQLLEQPEKTS